MFTVVSITLCDIVKLWNLTFLSESCKQCHQLFLLFYMPPIWGLVFIQFFTFMPFLSKFLIQFLLNAPWICVFIPFFFYFTIAWIFLIHYISNNFFFSCLRERVFMNYCLTKMDTNNAKAENNSKQVKYESFETSQTIIEQDRDFLKVWTTWFQWLLHFMQWNS